MGQLSSHYIANMIREDITSVKCVFVNDNNYEQKKQYTFKCKLDLAKDLNVGDLVIVEAGDKDKVQVVKLERVDEVASFDENIRYKWVFGKVDKEYLEELKTEDKRIEENLEARKKRAMIQAFANELGVKSSDLLEDARTRKV